MKPTNPGVAVAAIGGASLLLTWYRPWQLNWGASRAEVDCAMPGDQVVPRPAFNATRAVTIAAAPQAIWPWIVQIGFGRGGWYSYDLLDNLGHRSAEELIPELQHLDVGDLVPLGPGKNSGMRVKELDMGRWVVWWDEKLRLTTWAWQLTPMSDGTTRLVTRVRSRSTWRHPSTVFWRVLSEAADFPMMRRCLLGIKRRAETAHPPTSTRSAVPTRTGEPAMTSRWLRTTGTATVQTLDSPAGTDSSRRGDRHSDMAGAR